MTNSIYDWPGVSSCGLATEFIGSVPFDKMSYSEIADFKAAVKKLEDANESLRVAKETVDGWATDENGRVSVHKDVILKSLSAAIYSMRGERK